MKETLERAVGQEGVLGAFVVSRHGICVADAGGDLRAMREEVPPFAGALRTILEGGDDHATARIDVAGGAWELAAHPLASDFLLLSVANGDGGDGRKRLVGKVAKDVGKILGKPGSG